MLCLNASQLLVPIFALSLSLTVLAQASDQVLPRLLMFLASSSKPGNKPSGLLIALPKVPALGFTLANNF